MLAECSGVAIDINLEAVPKPDGIALERWLLTFPSFGYLISVKPHDVAEVTARFMARGIAAADIGIVARGKRLTVGNGVASETIWDFAEMPLIGAGPPSHIAVEAVA
jgi:selenophosphate synthetase-related protein